MVRYFIVDGTLFKFDGDKLNTLKRGWISIKDYFLVDEDGTIENEEVHAGDVVVTYYSDNKHGKKFTIHPKGSVVAEMITESINNRKNHEDSLPDCNPQGTCKEANETI